MKKIRVFEPVRLRRKPSTKRWRLISTTLFRMAGTYVDRTCGRQLDPEGDEPNAFNAFGQPITLPSAGTIEGSRWRAESKPY